MTLSALQEALQEASPRLTRRKTPWQSLVMTLVIYGAWAILLSRAFLAPNVFAWSIGIAYIAYDTLQVLYVACRTTGLLRLKRPAPEFQTPPLSVTAIIAAHNEAEVLGKTIAALLAQQPPPDQIILADDGSDDDTVRVLEELYALSPPQLGFISDPSRIAPGLQWLRLARGGKASALNQALLHSKGDIIMTVDADTLLEAGAVAAFRHEFAADARLLAAGGLLTPICDSSLSGKLFQWFQTYEYRRNFIARYAWSRSDCLLLISGAFAAYRSEDLRLVGGFDPTSFVEDYELIHRLYRRAVEQDQTCHVRIIAGARARTDAPARLMAFLRQRRRWFAGFLQTQYWNRDMTGSARFGSLGLLMMPVKLVDSFQPIYGLTAFFLLVYFLAVGRFQLAGAALAIMLGKIIIDLFFHLWSLALYRRWSGATGRIRPFHAALAALCEPFSFQLLRHSAAFWGWIAFLTRRQNWTGQQRHGLLQPPPRLK